MKPFLILQLRPETEASDNEYDAILAKGGLTPDRSHRIRLDCEGIPADLRLGDYAGTIVGGGPGCVSDPPERKSPVEARIEAAVMGLMPEITSRDLPFLGCCYGIGILAHHLGGRVTKEAHSEPVGTSPCALTLDGREDPLLAGCPDEFDAFVGHKEAVQALPPGAVHLVSSGPCPYQMIRHGRNVYATQFHPEADAEGFELRIEIYKHRGYFPPKDAERLVTMCRAADVTAPEHVLRNFVSRYG
ncbi:MAG: glutamine amidotransferase [Rhodobacteraceae bacterium]|nr:glutamine amidotransferase [Paracoccaceae bacterium]